MTPGRPNGGALSSLTTTQRCRANSSASLKFSHSSRTQGCAPRSNNLSSHDAAESLGDKAAQPQTTRWRSLRRAASSRCRDGDHPLRRHPSSRSEGTPSPYGNGSSRGRRPLRSRARPPCKGGRALAGRKHSGPADVYGDSTAGGQIFCQVGVNKSTFLK